MNKKELNNQFLVAFGVLSFFSIGLAIGNLTSPTPSKNDTEKKSDYELTVMVNSIQDSIQNKK